MPSTSLSDIDRAVARVKHGAARFARLSLDARIGLLEKLRASYLAIAPELTRASCQAKGIPEDDPATGQEWINDPLVVVRHLRLLAQSLREIRDAGRPQLRREWLRTLPDGRLAVRVYPRNALEAAVLPRHRAWVHMERGVTAENLPQHQASFYRAPHGGRLCAVLGAGNVNSIPPTDCLTKLFVEGTACVLKTNPVNAFVGPLLERAFAPLVEIDAFAVIYGAADEGSHLVRHPDVDEVHVTGSDRTHDALVWGPPGPERDARQARNEPVLDKEIGSELGNVTPVIVVPGPYSEAELRFQAANVAGMVTNNASFNCNAAKLLVVARDWPLRERFLSLVEAALSRVPPRQAYYPGARERFATFTRGRRGLKLLGQPLPDGALPWALIPDVDAGRADDLVFREEPWCSVLSETRLPGRAPLEFLCNAVAFVNTQVWGTLCTTVIAHPSTWRAAQDRKAWNQALDDLRYGAVAVNSWSAAMFALGSTPWGAYPGAPLHDIQSGRGFVHNALMLEGIEKVVLTAPLRTFPAPPWFPGHRTLRQLGERLVAFEDRPSWLKLVGVAAAALRA